MKTIIATIIALITTLFMATVASADVYQRTDVLTTVINHYYNRVVPAGQSDFIAPVLLRTGLTHVFVMNDMLGMSGPTTSGAPMGCFAVPIEMTLLEASGPAIAGEFNMGHCSFDIIVVRPTLVGLMVENDSQSKHTYTITTIRSEMNK